jgi:hypothetical protein
MKMSRYGEKQIIGILKQHEAGPETADRRRPSVQVVRVLEKVRHPALRAGANSHRQWHGVHYEGDGPVGVRAQSEAALHHAGQTNGERLRRIVPRKFP